MAVDSTQFQQDSRREADAPQSESWHEILVLVVACGSQAPAVVRAALGEIEALGAARDDLVLVASELVTNAVIHSGGSPADTIEVRASLVRGGVSISVRDPGLSGQSLRLQNADGVQANGWGLRIVQELAERWGSERDRGYRVWAELSSSPAATAPAGK
jgi:anti-sigma regulatory factor (Ser/Thr protein kinase)